MPPNFRKNTTLRIITPCRPPSRYIPFSGDAHAGGSKLPVCPVWRQTPTCSDINHERTPFLASWSQDGSDVSGTRLKFYDHGRRSLNPVHGRPPAAKFTLSNQLERTTTGAHRAASRRACPLDCRCVGSLYKAPNTEYPQPSGHRERLAVEEGVPAAELVQADALRTLYRKRTHRRAS